MDPKPAKPRPDFPLYAHACGRWAKRIKGRVIYFGPWADWQGSLEQYLRERQDWESGADPRRATIGATVGELCNEFRTSKLAQFESGELSKIGLNEYTRTTDMLVAELGKGRPVASLSPGDFRAMRLKLAKRLSVVTVKNEIQRVRTVFNYGHNSLGLPQPNYGAEWQPPSKRAMRLAKAARGRRWFDAAEIQLLLDHASKQLRGMILLGVNCGFGNADCGHLERKYLDLDGGWVEYHRPKTGIWRRAKLWPETIQAIRVVMARKESHLVFLTQRGNSWISDRDSPLTKQFSRLMVAAGVNPNGRNFYGCRHTFRHVADSAGDQPAANVIMGHADNSMASHYRGDVDDDRLSAVADHVHKWLWGDKKGKKK